MSITEKVLNDYVNILLAKVNSLDLEIEGIQIRRKEIVKELQEINKEIQSICTHEEVLKLTEYTEGGYDHKSMTIDTYRCRKCNKVMSIETSYGGYA